MATIKAQQVDLPFFNVDLLTKIRYSITRHVYTRGFHVDKTANQRQQKYREQIVKGEKKRLQVVIDRNEAKKLDQICTAEGISKTDFIRRAIESWSGK